ncbi:hypothetical protein K2X33_09915 [bacterium]|nr:hypothetical protein [bacterium]
MNSLIALLLGFSGSVGHSKVSIGIPDLKPRPIMKIKCSGDLGEIEASYYPLGNWNELESYALYLKPTTLAAEGTPLEVRRENPVTKVMHIGGTQLGLAKGVETFGGIVRRLSLEEVPVLQIVTFDSVNGRQLSSTCEVPELPEKPPTPPKRQVAASRYGYAKCEGPQGNYGIKIVPTTAPDLYEVYAEPLVAVIGAKAFTLRRGKTSIYLENSLGMKPESHFLGIVSSQEMQTSSQLAIHDGTGAPQANPANVQLCDLPKIIDHAPEGTKAGEKPAGAPGPKGPPGASGPSGSNKKPTHVEP